MKKFFVIANMNKDEGLKMASSVTEYLRSKGCQAEKAGISRVYGDSSSQDDIVKSVPDDTEAVIALGGDGTIIQIAAALAKKKIPLLGINLGTLGYLAEVDKDNIEPTLDRLIADDYEIEERMMLKGSVVKDGEDIGTYRALNEVVIMRTGAVRVIRYDIYVNDRLLNSYDADGIIVSTPTGSTGYNMSAGGPIVEPDAKVILMTPVSAHTLNSRSIVLSPDDKLKIAIAQSRVETPQGTQVCFDGGKCFDVSPGDYVEIERANRITRVIKMSKESFLDTLSRKMSS